MCEGVIPAKRKYIEKSEKQETQIASEREINSKRFSHRKKASQRDREGTFFFFVFFCSCVATALKVNSIREAKRREERREKRKVTSSSILRCKSASCFTFDILIF